VNFKNGPVARKRGGFFFHQKGPRHMTKEKVKLVCPHCGSDDVYMTNSQTARWDVEAQEWDWDWGLNDIGHHCSDCSEININTDFVLIEVSKPVVAAE
jgi:hypothetical protein